MNRPGAAAPGCRGFWRVCTPVLLLPARVWAWEPRMPWGRRLFHHRLFARLCMGAAGLHCKNAAACIKRASRYWPSRRMQGSKGQGTERRVKEALPEQAIPFIQDDERLLCPCIYYTYMGVRWEWKFCEYFIVSWFIVLLFDYQCGNAWLKRAVYVTIHGSQALNRNLLIRNF